MSKPAPATKLGDEKSAGERKRCDKAKCKGKEEETEATRKKATAQSLKPARRTVLDGRKGVPGHQAVVQAFRMYEYTATALCRLDES